MTTKKLDKETDKKLGQIVKAVGSYRVESTVKHKPRLTNAWLLCAHCGETYEVNEHNVHKCRVKKYKDSL